jgi:hexosaminidase
MNKPFFSTSMSALSTVVIVIMCFALQAGAAAAPNTIPAVQSWTTGTGTLIFSTSSRIVVNTSDSAALAADAKTFQQDMNGLSTVNRTVPIVYATSATTTGDIFLHLVTDATIGTEGYNMVIGSTAIDIGAQTAAGVFYGTRTVLQMFKASTTVNQGTIKDYPIGKWRGQMVDAGRKYYTVAWLQTLIRDLAYVKMNVFHFHLSDGLSATNNGGFRLQSARYVHTILLGRGDPRAHCACEQISRHHCSGTRFAGPCQLAVCEPQEPSACFTGAGVPVLGP